MRKQIRWICTNADGGLSVVASASLEDLARIGIITEAEVRKLCLRKSFIGCTDIREMPAGWTPPEDRTFRNAWRVKGKSRECVAHKECRDIEIDMPHAKDIHREYLRRKRIAKLEELDVAYMRADEAGNKKLKAEITSKKQALRDITAHPDFKKARTVEQIKAIKIIV